MQSLGATEPGPQSDNKLGGKFSGFCQAAAGAGCQVGPRKATASCPAQHSQARLVPEQAGPHTETQEDREMGRGYESVGRSSVGVRGGPQSQRERAERVGRRGEGRVKGLQAQGRGGVGRPSHQALSSATDFRNPELPRPPPPGNSGCL